MAEIVFVRFQGGPLDAQHLFYERKEGEPWPPPRHAWFVRNKGGYTVWQAKPDGSKPDRLRGFKVARYRRISSTVPDVDGEPRNAVHGAFYAYDPEEEAPE